MSDKDTSNIDKLKEKLNKIDIQKLELFERIEKRIINIIWDLEPIIIKEFPEINNSSDFKNKYQRLLSKCICGIGYILAIDEFTKEQIDYIWNQLDGRLDEFYNMMVKREKIKQDKMDKQYKDYYKE
ncbi:MAG: hypothetical protein ACOCZ5_02970 [bacterium]